MNLEAAVSVIHSVITVALTLVGPFLGVALIVGVMVSLFQTVTSIQDATLAFVPKLLTLMVLLFVGAHWALRLLMQFSVTIFQYLPEMVR